MYIRTQRTLAVGVSVNIIYIINTRKSGENEIFSTDYPPFYFIKVKMISKIMTIYVILMYHHIEKVSQSKSEIQFKIL